MGSLLIRALCADWLSPLADYHSIYIGLPMPHSDQKKRRKRRSSFSQDKNGERKRPSEQQIQLDTEEGRRTGDVSGNDPASRTSE